MTNNDIDKRAPSSELVLSKSWYQRASEDETSTLDSLCQETLFSPEEQAMIEKDSRALLNATRHSKTRRSDGHSAFLTEYNLASEEGVALMCLAEALVRTPDGDTAKQLITEKLQQGQWQTHLGNSNSFWVNASTWGLLLTGRAFRPNRENRHNILTQALRKIGGSLAHTTLQQAITLLGERFLFSNSVSEALQALSQQPNTRATLDLIHNTAITPREAEAQYLQYQSALESIGRHTTDEQSLYTLNLKVSALHERFEPLKANAYPVLQSRLKSLAQLAANYHIPIIIEAEQTWRWEATLRLFHDCLTDPELPRSYHGFGLTLQAYQRSTLATIEWLARLAKQTGRRIPIRLCKGNDWDTEILWTQAQGIRDFPIFTKKSFTDLNYLVCAKKLLSHPDCFYPCFATHNTNSIAAVYRLSTKTKNPDFELQQVYGQGDTLNSELRKIKPDVTLRLHTPIGRAQKILPFLIRKLFENGVNSSFLHLASNLDIPESQLIQDAKQAAQADLTKPQHVIMNARDLFQPGWENAAGIDLSNEMRLTTVLDQIKQYANYTYSGYDEDQPIRNPARRQHILGSHHFTSGREIISAIEALKAYWPTWRHICVHNRAASLERLADLLESHREELMALCIMETAKTLPAALYEVRQAVNFCRFNAAQARQYLAHPKTLPGAFGFKHEHILFGRGVFACMSPSSSPLAAAAGQISSALVTGNCVIAKPAMTAELVGRKLASLFYLAGFTEAELRFTPCTSRVFSTVALSDGRLSGISFAGSQDNAEAIKLQLAQIRGHIPTFLPEIGGMNVLIMDSTVCIEDVVPKLIDSAFGCAGQRADSIQCAFIPEETLESTLTLLRERMLSLTLGDPLDPSTDVGPLISENAMNAFSQHLEAIKPCQSQIFQIDIAPHLSEQGHFAPPTLAVLEPLKFLPPTPMAPILHIIPYESRDWAKTLATLDQTAGIRSAIVFSKLDARTEQARALLHVGSLSINRPFMPAVVGCQPLGGQPCSGHSLGSPYAFRPYVKEQFVSQGLTNAMQTTLLDSYSSTRASHDEAPSHSQDDTLVAP
jgi:RHH-type proline utilization regulon transcriptional repressor/proline dehydrogenase/delta 1-pyrroline-5-carboxylate dehydrogenase